MSIINRLDEIAARAEAATCGPWLHKDDKGGDGWPVMVVGNSQEDGKDHTVWTSPMPASEVDGDASTDAAFIAAARTDVPELVAALRRAVWLLTRLNDANDTETNDARTYAEARAFLAGDGGA